MTTEWIEPLAMGERKHKQECVLTTDDPKLTLSELVEIIERTLSTDKTTPLHQKTDIEAALGRFSDHLSPELERFMLTDDAKNYTRNLIATDHQTYALMLLCWNRGKFSPIHDHPCDGCWVKVLQGQVQEIRYQVSSRSSHDDLDDRKRQSPKLVETYNVISSSGVSFMHDSLGIHQVGNPSSEVDAVTLHLYAPPFEKCRLWSDVDDSSKSSEAYSCYYSEFGHKIEY